MVRATRKAVVLLAALVLVLVSSWGMVLVLCGERGAGEARPVSLAFSLAATALVVAALVVVVSARARAPR